MLMGALICMFVATAILAVSVCFSKKNKTLCFLLQTLSLIALVCLGLVAGNYKNNFSGYTIFLILAIIPQFISLFDLSEYLKTKAIKTEENEESSIAEITEIENTVESILEDIAVEENSTDTKNKKKKEKKKKIKKESKHHFLNSNGLLLKSVAMVMTSICLGLAGVYIGMETFYGFLIGVALACALLFLLLIIKKTINPYDALSYFFMFLAIGIIVGQIVTVLLFSFNLTNILFSVGALIYCVYVGLSAFVKSNFDHLAFFVAFFCLISTLII